MEYLKKCFEILSACANNSFSEESTDSYGLCKRCQILFSIYIKTNWEKNVTELFNQWLNEYRNEVLEKFIIARKSLFYCHTESKYD